MSSELQEVIDRADNFPVKGLVLGVTKKEPNEISILLFCSKEEYFSGVAEFVWWKVFVLKQIKKP
jgi:hypothetical protein